jgi:hypothetical protein
MQFSSSSKEPLQFLLPFAGHCGRYSGVCPLTELSSIGIIYFPRCDCIAQQTTTCSSS